MQGRDASGEFPLLGVSFTSLLPPPGISFFAGVCLAGALFGWGRFSGLRLTFSTCQQSEVMPENMGPLGSDFPVNPLRRTCLFPPCHHSSADMAAVMPAVSGKRSS